MNKSTPCVGCKTFTFKSDGTYFETSGSGGGFPGTYTISGGNLTFDDVSSGPTETYPFTVTETTLTLVSLTSDCTYQEVFTRKQVPPFNPFKRSQYLHLKSPVNKVFSILLVLLISALPGLSQVLSKAQELYERGEKALANKEYFKAQAHYTECLRLEPRFAEAYRSRGITREYLGESAKALTDFNIYVDLRPTDAEGVFNRAVLRFDAKQYLLARQDFLNFLKLPPGAETNTVYYSQEKFGNGATKISTAQTGAKDHIYNYLGQIETQLKRYPIAIHWLDSAILIAPTNAAYHVNRGIAKIERGDKAGATIDYEQALKLDPDNSLALHNLAAVKSLSGDTHGAEKLLSESIAKNEKLPYPRAERGYQRLQSNDLKGALEDYNEVVRLEPKEEENYINRGLVKEKMKNLDGALADFSQAIKLNEKNPRAWVCRGNVVSKMGRWKEAIEDYTVAISHDAKHGRAFYNRAICQQNAGNAFEACVDLKAASSLGIKDADKLIPRICK